MRFLPYLLVAAMAVPMLIWVLINAFVIKGTATAFSHGDLGVLISLGCFVVVAFVSLSFWMSRQIVRTHQR